MCLCSNAPSSQNSDNDVSNTIWFINNFTIQIFITVYRIILTYLFIIWLCFHRLLALKALNSRLVDTNKDAPRMDNIESERRDSVVISIGDSEQTSKLSPANMVSNKTT